MGARGRCGRWLTGGALLCLLAPGCERGAAGDAARRPDADVAVLQAPRLDLERAVAVLAARSSRGTRLTPPTEYDAYLALSSQASDGQLRQLLQHPSPEVRVYAFQALAERHPESALFSDLSAVMTDLAEVQQRTASTVADVALERVEQRLAGDERDAIARQLLSRGAPARSAARAKREWTFGPALHEPLRQLVREGDGEALLALARYHDPEDVPLFVAALRAPTAARALLAMAEFPDPRLLSTLQAFQRGLLGLRIEPPTDSGELRVPPSQWQHLRDPNAQVLCQFYATAVRFPAAEAETLLAAPLARGAATADVSAHLTCQRWALQPDVLPRHVAAGFRLWEHGLGLSLEQVQVLWAREPERARRLALASAAGLERFDADTIVWLLRQTQGGERATALRALREGLRRAGKKNLESLCDVVRQLELRELLPELFARLERSRPLANAEMATFQQELTRPLVWQIARWPLNEPERQRLVRWVLGGREARERDTRDSIGQKIVEDYLVDVLIRAGLLHPGSAHEALDHGHADLEQDQ